MRIIKDRNNCCTFIYEYKYLRYKNIKYRIWRPNPKAETLEIHCYKNRKLTLFYSLYFFKVLQNCYAIEKVNWFILKTYIFCRCTECIGNLKFKPQFLYKKNVSHVIWWAFYLKFSPLLGSFSLRFLLSGCVTISDAWSSTLKMVWLTFPVPNNLLGGVSKAEKLGHMGV